MSIEDTSIGDWLAALASRTPAPGGGAAAALCAATASSLLAMVAEYTTGDKWADRECRMRSLAEDLAARTVHAVALADADADAFQAVGAAYKLPRGSDEQRTGRQLAIQEALIGAAEPPVRTGELARRLVALAKELADSGNPNVLSDVAVASSMARSAMESAIVNIEINRAQIRDDDVVKRLTEAIERLTDAIAAADQVTRRQAGPGSAARRPVSCRRWHGRPPGRRASACQPASPLPAARPDHRGHGRTRWRDRAAFATPTTTGSRESPASRSNGSRRKAHCDRITVIAARRSQLAVRLGGPAGGQRALTRG